MHNPVIASGGPAPQTPRDFPHRRRRQKGRRWSEQPPASKATAFFTIRRSGCVPAEPYPSDRTNRVALLGGLCYYLHYFECVNGCAQTQKPDRFYILTKPFYCPAFGEGLKDPWQFLDFDPSTGNIVALSLIHI